MSSIPRLRILRTYTHELAPGTQLMIGGHNSYVTRNNDVLQYYDDEARDWLDIPVVEKNDRRSPAERLEEKQREERAAARANDPAFKNAVRMMREAVVKQTGKTNGKV